jgi:hypothetical protein
MALDAKQVLQGLLKVGADFRGSLQVTTPTSKVRALKWIPTTLAFSS